MIHSITYTILVASLTILSYTWLVYPVILSLFRTRKSRPALGQGQPHVTVLITVRNGAEKIVERLENVLDQDYAQDRLRVFVANDGSTDETSDRARSISDRRVTVVDFPHAGKSVTQNAALERISDEIIVVTDVDTGFTPGFLKAITSRFADPKIGCVSGRLHFIKSSETVSESQSLYWRYEIWMRRKESEMGLLATATGACMAFRRELFRPLLPSCGEDCTVPLDAVDQGFLVVHADDAVAYDRQPDTAKGELKARARMTSRNLRGTLTYPQLLSPWLHPGYAFSLWSHKLLRWATPIFLAAIVVSSIALSSEVRPLIWAELAFSACTALGFIFHVAGIPQPRICSTSFSFSLANCGFLLGIFQFLSGNEPVSYSN